MLHELLAGQPVFSGDNDYQLMHQHMDVPPKPLRTLRPDVDDHSGQVASLRGVSVPLAESRTAAAER